jgi:hypothetical protein
MALVLYGSTMCQEAAWHAQMATSEHASQLGQHKAQEVHTRIVSFLFVF